MLRVSEARRLENDAPLVPLMDQVCFAVSIAAMGFKPTSLCNATFGQRVAEICVVITKLRKSLKSISFLTKKSLPQLSHLC